MSLALLHHPSEAEQWFRGARRAGERVALVPTMGALHEGHLALVRRAAAECDRVATSIFVNPLQFNDPRDYERYPRTLERDAEMLAGAGCHMAFTGTLREFFPDAVRADGGFEESALLDPGPAAEGLEGAWRPGHFRGVATIVERLFRLSEPERAYFGQKDYQQTLVVRDLARRRGGPVIVVCPTVRERSGLALSSRNALLGAEERGEALAIVAALRAAHLLWQRGEREPAELARALRERIALSRLELEYAEVRDPEHWQAAAPRGPLERAVALIAAKAGSVRLIDNMLLHQPEGGEAGLAGAAGEPMRVTPPLPQARPTAP